MQTDTIREKKYGGGLSYNARSVTMHLVVNEDCFFKANNAMVTEVRLVSKKAEE